MVYTVCYRYRQSVYLQHFFSYYRSTILQVPVFGTSCILRKSIYELLKVNIDSTLLFCVCHMYVISRRHTRHIGAGKMKQLLLSLKGRELHRRYEEYTTSSR
jgi:hypothetical protein